jgi:hypothetical protein
VHLNQPEAMRDQQYKYAGTLTARCDEKLANGVIKAAGREFTRPSDLIRRAVAAHLRASGDLRLDDE